MLNNLGMPGMLLLIFITFLLGMGVYSYAKVPNFDANFNFAGFWRRLIAGLIDGVAMGLIALIPAFALGYAARVNMSATATAGEIQTTAEALGNLLSFFIGWLYFTLLESSSHQGTLGKMIFGLRVVDMNGRRIGFGRANARYFGKILMVFTLFIGYMMMGWTKKKQALYDKMSGCLVVRKDSPLLLGAETAAPRQSYQVNLDYKGQQPLERKIPPTISKPNKPYDNLTEEEAIKKFRGGEIDEKTLGEILKRNSR